MARLLGREKKKEKGEDKLESGHSGIEKTEKAEKDWGKNKEKERRWWPQDDSRVLW